MARKDSEHQKKSMSMLFRGKAIFKPLNTGHIDEHVTWWAAISGPARIRRSSRRSAARTMRKLKAAGYEAARLIDTSDGTFMGKKEAAWLGLSGSTLLVGKK